MANDSTSAGQIASDQDVTPNNDGYFADMQGDADAFFGPEQLAQATNTEKVDVPQGQNVIRVQVSPGEIIELSSPFDAGSPLLGREENGNLAIKVGDVTVILVGYVEANAAAPVAVETSDGQPIDVATLLASTDPSIDIQTAAGPGAEGPQGQGADNTGAILALLQGGAGLGGFTAVGAQEGTSLTYGTIDNSILLDRVDTLDAAGTLSPSPFKGVQEPFLRDPFNNDHFDDFAQFYAAYGEYVGVTNQGQGWADFNGTAVSGTDFESYLEQTSFTNLVTHNSASQETLRLDQYELEAFFSDAANGNANPWTSNGSPLKVEMSADGTTAFVRRDDVEGALVLVIHAHAAGDITDQDTNGNFEIDTYLINRLDHPDVGQDILGLTVPYQIWHMGSEEQSEVPPTVGSVEVEILDDVPLAHEVEYTSFYGKDAPDEEGPAARALKNGGGHDTFTSKDFGSVDEDWLSGNKWDHNQGNKDKDNDPSGANSDDLHGDDLGRTKVTGTLNIDFGADGPAGAGGNDCLISKDALPIALALDNIPDVGKPFKDADGHEMKSDGHELVVLEHYVDSHGIEHLVVGYSTETATPAAAIFEFGDGLPDDGCGCGSDTVKVFELKLNVDPNDDNGNGLDFQDFKFELFKGIDQDNTNGGTVETNTPLKFDVVGHDDDGDPVETAINIHVNDDAPRLVGETCYLGFKGGLEVPALSAFAMLAADFDVGGLGLGLLKQLDLTKGFGRVDEDWLIGAGNNDTNGAGQSNALKDGDTYGTTIVFGLLNVDFGGDGPKEKNAYALTTFKEGDTFKDADGTIYHSGTHELKVLESSEGHILVGYEDGDAQEKIFELTLSTDPADGPLFGGFGFVLHGPIDHPDNPNEETLPIQFKVTASDADGDTVTATIDIQVNDDKPEIAVSYHDEVPSQRESLVAAVVALPATVGHVDEDQLSNGNHDWGYTNGGTEFYNPGENGDDGGYTQVTGQASIKYGGDGPGDAPTGYGLESAGKGTPFEDADGNAYKSGDKDLVIISSDKHELVVGTDANDEDSAVFTLTVEDDGTFTFTLKGPINEGEGDNTEGNATLSFKVISDATDGDGDFATGTIKIQVDDDVPYAIDDCPDPKEVFDGVADNVLLNDKPGADGWYKTDGQVTAVFQIEALDVGRNVVRSDDVTKDGPTQIQGELGMLTLAADGTWSYELDDAEVVGSDIFRYTAKDADGDSVQAELIVTTGFREVEVDSFAAKLVGPTHEPADHYDREVTVTGLNGVVSPFDSKSYHFEDATGGHLISGGAGNDYIVVSGNTGSILNGGAGDDIIHGGGGKDVITGAKGDDTLFGGNDADSFFGGAGHDAMSGGDGDDTFNGVDADDLDGANTLDGVHSIDGGKGYDTVDISGLKTFDSNQALSLENIEHLALDGKANGGGGTTVTLNYDAAYGITQVGGLQTLTISGDKADSVHLQGSSGFTWADHGNGEYQAGLVTVKVEQGVHVELS